MINPSTFNFTEDFILEDDFVRLTPLSLEHIAPLSKISNDSEIWTYLYEKGDTPIRIAEYIVNAIDQRKLEKEYPFVVYNKEKREYAGTTRFYEYSEFLNTIKLGHTWYGKSNRGTGLNKHCKNLLFTFAFEKLRIGRIGFDVYADNDRCIMALLGVGCKREGILRNMFPSISGNGRTDAILMSILNEEWFVQDKSELMLSSIS